MEERKKEGKEGEREGKNNYLFTSYTHTYCYLENKITIFKSKFIHIIYLVWLLLSTDWTIIINEI